METLQNYNQLYKNRANIDGTRILIRGFMQWEENEKSLEILRHLNAKYFLIFGGEEEDKAEEEENEDNRILIPRMEELQILLLNLKNKPWNSRDVLLLIINSFQFQTQKIEEILNDLSGIRESERGKHSLIQSYKEINTLPLTIFNNFFLSIRRNFLNILNHKVLKAYEKLDEEGGKIQD